MKLSKKISLKYLVPVVIIAGIFVFITKSRAQTDFEIPTNLQSQNESKWWSNDYAYRRKLVRSEETDQILKLNHSQLVIDNKSSATGSDLKIIAQDSEDFQEIPCDITSPDQIETYISFSFKNSSKELYLYYGNKSDLPEPSKKDAKYINITPTASLMDEEAPTLSMAIQKKWNLNEKNSKLILQVTDSSGSENSSYYYIADDTKTPINVSLQNNLISISVSDFKTGNHNLFLIKKVNDQIIRSNSSSFIVSEPIYIAWTIDWEGVDPGKQNLEEVAKLSDQNKIPLSHFFSPRTLTNINISDSRKKEIVNWLKNRIASAGDEVDMMLHFQFDLIEETGVDSKFKEQTWDNGLTGYDMPGTVYNYDDYSKILAWSKKKMMDSGLPEPKGYRAGGWFINEENLRAVKDNGFLYDSSAIKPIEIGENKMIQDWKVSSITMPYRLAAKDKNNSTDDVNSLIEIPINGGDSYINSDEEIQNNFNDNYNSQTFSNTSKLIVYSSSPEWIQAGKESLEKLFATASTFRYDIDRGPIKFVTLSDWYANNISR